MAARARSTVCVLLILLAAASAPAPATAVRLPWVADQNGGGTIWDWFKANSKQAGSQNQDQKQGKGGKSNSKSEGAIGTRNEVQAANNALGKDPNYSIFNQGGNTLSRIIGFFRPQQPITIFAPSNKALKKAYGNAPWWLNLPSMFGSNIVSGLFVPNQDYSGLRKAGRLVGSNIRPLSSLVFKNGATATAAQLVKGTIYRGRYLAVYGVDQLIQK